MDSRWLALVVCACVGCASPGQPSASDPVDRTGSGFPKPEALYALRDRSLQPGSPFGSTHRDVASWSLAGPFPEVASHAPRPGGQAWDPLLDELIRSRAGLAIASAAMECLAREAGRFVVEHRALPGLGLQRFLTGRCAVVTEAPTVATFSWESSRSLSLGEAITKLGGPIRALLRNHVVGGPLDVGIWLHSKDGRVDLVVAMGERSVRLDPMPTVVASGSQIVLAGEVLRSASSVTAVVTRGVFDWEVCEPVEGVTLPRFRLVCSVDAADASSWLSLHYLPPGHVLAQSIAQLLIRKPGNQADRYRRHRHAEPRSATRTEQVPGAFLELLNQLRAEAEAPPLALAPEQSRVAREVAPYYFSALMDAQAGTAELVALGMMAGWEVDEIVQEGRFAFTWLTDSRDVASLLSDVLDSPEARMALLWNELDQIAIGAVVGEDGATGYLGLIAATYRVFSEEDPLENASRVSRNLTRARAERSRAAARRLESVGPLAAAAASRIQGGATPQDVLGELIQESVDTLQRSVMGWVAETRDLDDIVFPDEFLERTELGIAISVTSRRPKGEPWGRYVVLMLAAEPDSRLR